MSMCFKQMNANLARLWVVGLEGLQQLSHEPLHLSLQAAQLGEGNRQVKPPALMFGEQWVFGQARRGKVQVVEDAALQL